MLATILKSPKTIYYKWARVYPLFPVRGIISVEKTKAHAHGFQILVEDSYTTGCPKHCRVLRATPLWRIARLAAIIKIILSKKNNIFVFY